MAKNPAAVKLGKRSGINMTEEQRAERARNAANARADSLTKARRKAIAKKAAAARWAGKDTK